MELSSSDRLPSTSVVDTGAANGIFSSAREAAASVQGNAYSRNIGFNSMFRLKAEGISPSLRKAGSIVARLGCQTVPRRPKKSRMSRF
jgi:hypothetical protein